MGLRFCAADFGVDADGCLPALIFAHRAFAAAEIFDLAAGDIPELGLGWGAETPAPSTFESSVWS